MFNSEFYPTPRHVLDMMGIDCYGKICADFSAGKGDIVDYLKEHGASRVVACEINEDLCKILAPKCELIGRDFFTVEAAQVSHIQAIYINPPFSNADRHILHAWNVAPEGCEITALCNWETVRNSTYSSFRTELQKLIELYGEMQNLGSCFTIAERKTNVEIGLVKLFKPAVSEGFDFDGFYLLDDTEEGENGIISYNEIRAIVNSYVAAVKCFDKCAEVMHEMNKNTNAFGYSQTFSFTVEYNQTVCTKEDFARAMQVKAWKHIFKKVNIEKYVTKGVMADINAFINSRINYPFTMKNVYRMLEIIIGTRTSIMNRAIVEAVDNFTKHTHENRYGVEGWKTNEGHLLNKKFICGWISTISYSGGMELRTYQCRNTDYIIDLIKALCFITATDFDSLKPAYEWRNMKPNTWYDWGFFEFKVFKKGTGHFKFKDEKVWENLNRTYAKIKGQALPEKF